MSDHRPVDPRMPPEAYLYTQGRSRNVTMIAGPGLRLVREDVATRRINRLRAALDQIADCADDPVARSVAAKALEDDDAVPNNPGARSDPAAGT